ncbi:MAG TPA: GAF and ANTAR domain-containing protein, partial [Pedococcus sp.]|nr:GAF and ANTAR domain-containing protein [Pedococcus sp.]
LTSGQRLARVFVELADTLVDEFDALDFLATLADRSVELLGADAAGVIIRDDHDSLHVVASTSDTAELLELFELQNDEGPCLECLRGGQPVVNVGLAGARARWPRFSAAATEVGFQSTHALPLRHRDSVVGALNLFCATAAPLSPEDVTLGQALADIATIGLLQERAVRESGLLAEQLQTALHSRVMVEQAKGALLAGAEIPVDDAFELLRRYARSHNVLVREVARQVVERRLTAEDLRA